MEATPTTSDQAAQNRPRFTGQALDYATLARIGTGRAVPELDETALARLAEARQTMEDHLSRNAAIYGATTGVGAMKDVRWSPEEIEEFNKGLVRAHHFGTGEPFPDRIVRMAIAIRINTALTGRVGCSRKLVEGYTQLLEHDIIPIVRRTGSIGCADIGLMGQLSAVLWGVGETVYEGRRMDAAGALESAGLEPMVLGPRDSLAAIAVNAISLAAGADVLQRAAGALRVMLATGLAAAEALGASRQPWQSVTAVGTQCEADIGAWLWERARRIGWTEVTHVHDPLSLRVMPQVFGTTFRSLMFASDTLLAATGRTDDNPVVIGNEVLTSGNSLPLDATVYLQAAQLAVAHAARNAFNRCALLANGGRRDLPVNLVPPGCVATGFGPSLKLAGELYRRISILAQPVSMDALTVAAGMEDEAAFLPLVVERLEDQVRAMHRLSALEAIFTCQAMDILGDEPRGVPGLIYERTRRHVAYYTADRPLSAGVEAVEAELLSTDTMAELLERGPLSKIDSYFALGSVSWPAASERSGGGQA